MRSTMRSQTIKIMERLRQNCLIQSNQKSLNCSPEFQTMSDYMIKMGVGPETHEEHLHQTINDLVMTIRFLQKGQNDKAKEWMYDQVLPSLENVYKEQDSKYGIKSESMLHRRGEYDWDLICSTPPVIL